MTVAETIAFFSGGDERHKSYPVVTRDGDLVGLIGRGDVLRWTRGDADGNDLLGDVCATVATAFADETAGALADRMAQGRFSRVPVIARGTRKLVGIVTRRELLRVRSLAATVETERHGAVKLPG
jgi:CBS domain-containing protein